MGHSIPATTSPKVAKPELIEGFKNKHGVAGHNDPVYAAMIYYERRSSLPGDS